MVVGGDGASDEAGKSPIILPLNSLEQGNDDRG